MDLFPSSFFLQPLVSQDASADDVFALCASSLNALLKTADSVFEKIESRVRGGGPSPSLSHFLARSREERACMNLPSLPPHTPPPPSPWASPKMRTLQPPFLLRRLWGSARAWAP
jgi:hypothetical protein